MKLLTFSPSDGPPRIGVLMDDQTLVDLQEAARIVHGAPRAHFADMLALLDGAGAAMDDARALLERARSGMAEAVRAVSTVKVLAPVPRPRSIRDCMSFEKHIIQATRTVAKWTFPPVAVLDSLAEKLTGKPLIGPPKVWYQQPTYYKSNVFSVVGPEVDVVWPRYSNRLDYELEFGIFLGKQGKNIKASDARSHIAGFTIFNDFSARDTQLREMKGRLGPTKGKDFDTGNVLGPYLVTPDEIADPYALSMQARINGETWSQGSSADMQYRFEDLIAFISDEETLHPGEFIGSGTVGNGCGLELDRWLKPNDVVELEVQGLGILRNRVVKPA